MKATGVVLDVAARLQLNLLISPNPSLGLYSNVPKHFMPILWFEQKFTMPSEIATGITIANSIAWIGQIASMIVLTIGLTMLLWLPLNYFRHKLFTGNENGSKRKVALKELEKPKKLEDSPLLLENCGLVGCGI